jgi:G3E family GTPase
MRLDLLESVRRAALHASPPRRIVVIVDAAGGDDVVTVLYTILSDGDLGRLVRLDGVVHLIDAIALATRTSCGLAAGSVVELDALAIADRIVLERADQLTLCRHDELIALIGSINAVGTIRPGPMFELDAWHGVPNIERLPNRLDDAPETIVLRQDHLLDPEAVDEWLDRLIAGHATRLLRVQGVLSVVDSPARVCCHGVRSFAMSHSELEHAHPPSCDESLLVIVGRGLDRSELTASFEATRAR